MSDFSKVFLAKELLQKSRVFWGQKMLIVNDCSELRTINLVPEMPSIGYNIVTQPRRLCVRYLRDFTLCYFGVTNVKGETWKGTRVP